MNVIQECEGQGRADVRRAIFPHASATRDLLLTVDEWMNCEVAGEEVAIEQAIEQVSVDPTRRQWRALFRLLLDTGMRLGEAVSIECVWIRREYGFVIIPDSKNGSARHVALSDRAYAGLLDLTDGEPADSQVFRFTPWVAKDAWRNEIRVAAGCQDLRIHDLRHEALSRMAARGADLKTLMRQSGHKTVAVLMRYLNPTPAEQRARLFPANQSVELGSVPK